MYDHPQVYVNLLYIHYPWVYVLPQLSFHMLPVDNLVYFRMLYVYPYSIAYMLSLHNYLSTHTPILHTGN